ncbi:hypothetical protein HK104_005295, partial [Borealophlyctis nickersoniae]
METIFPGLPSVRFTYLRFRCQGIRQTSLSCSAFTPSNPPVLDVKRTIEFYQCLGMTLLHCYSQPTGNATVLAFEYRSASKVLNEAGVRIVFEARMGLDPARRASLAPLPRRRESIFVAREDIDEGGDESDTHRRRRRRPRPVMEEYPGHNHEHLVVYVRILDRMVKRLGGKGFTLRFPITDLFGVRIAVVTDPNGIELRLIQLTEQMLMEPPSIKNQWFARIAYYTLPTTQGDHTVRKYESMFSLAPPTPFKKPIMMNASSPSPSPSTGKKTGIGAHPRNSVGKQTAMFDEEAKDVDLSVLRPGEPGVGVRVEKRTGFRLVDTEDCIVGLTHTVYWWMACAPREISSGICFSPKTELSATCMTPQLSRMSSVLMGFGFDVPDLASAMRALSEEYPENIEFTEKNMVVPNMGYCSRFYDRTNNLWVDLVQTTHLPEDFGKDEIVTHLDVLSEERETEESDEALDVERRRDAGRPPLSPRKTVRITPPKSRDSDGPLSISSS